MPTDDYIKRSAARAYIADWFWSSYDSRSPGAVVDSIPAADVEPVRHGRWVKMTGMMPPEFTGHYSCSECDWFCKKHSIRETEFDFCPGCGAKMDEVSDND